MSKCSRFQVVTIICFLLIALCHCSQNSGAAKAYIKLAVDGFPTGRDTPEGIACDMVRAIQNNDSQAFKNVCIDQYNDKRYRNFIQMVTTDLDKHKRKHTVNPQNPEGIAKVYAARFLSTKGPASHAYAIYNYINIMFVDVGFIQNNGEPAINRTFVIQKSDKKWYVHPCPAINELLSMGLNEETKSSIDFKDKYLIKESYKKYFNYK